MSTSSHQYRIRLATPLPALFSTWFPQLRAQLEAQDDAAVVVEGPVTDPCQLAGIVSAICHRNGEILSVEQLDTRERERH